MPKKATKRKRGSSLKNVSGKTFKRYVKKNVKGRAKYAILNSDYDGDGVKNKKDCYPFDAKRQGYLHNLAIKRLKRLEEKTERKREKEQKKLEDLKDRLKVRSSIASKRGSIKSARLKQKQTIINELKREAKKLSEIKKANMLAKKELDKYTLTGKTKKYSKKAIMGAYRGSKATLKSTKAYILKPSTQRVLRRIQRNL